MSKKDYIAVAQAVAIGINGVNDPSTLRVVREVVDSLCGVFKRDNSRFDKDRFLTACKLEG